MESVFVLYADGTIVEADLHSGAVLRQVQSFQGAFHLSASQIACWPNSAASVASTLSSSTALILQNKNSSKAHFWSCFDVRGGRKRSKMKTLQKSRLPRVYAALTHANTIQHMRKPSGRCFIWDSYAYSQIWRQWKGYIDFEYFLWKIPVERFAIRLYFNHRNVAPVFSNLAS